jgi:hypothetical protein
VASTTLGCRTGACGESIRGPLVDVRGHYVHSRADAMAAMLETPSAWRATAELDRLRSSLDLRRLVNQRYVGGEVQELRLRSMHSLIDSIETQRQAS